MDRSNQLIYCNISFIFKCFEPFSNAGTGGHAVYTRILRGQPNVLQTISSQTDTKSKSPLQKLFAKITKKSNIKQDDTNKQGMELGQASVTDETAAARLTSPLTKKNIVPSAEKLNQVERDNIPDISKLDHYTVREDILDEIRKGQYIMEVAPSDLVDFGGQRSYDMTHQLFVQHRGTFIIMFNGRYEMKEPLKEYPQDNVTSECKY